MQLSISGQHLDITDNLRDHITLKFQKLTHHFEHITNVHVVLDVAKKRQHAEATVHVSGADLFASAQHENMYSAIDHLVAKLDRQIIKHKAKIQNHHRADHVKSAQYLR